MIKFNFFRFLACSFLVAGNLLCFVNLTWANPPQIRSTQQQKLRPMPEGSYQLARSVFLPNADDDIWYSEYDKIPGISTGESASNKCTESGYNLLSCPINGKCSPCPSDAAYKKLTSCAEGYKISASKTYCEKFCAANYCDKSSPSGYFMTSCPEGMNCGEPCVEISTNCNQMNYYKVTTECINGYHYEGGRCVKNCEEISCGGGSGTSRTWKDECPTGYLCTEIANYMTTDCKTGRCYQYKACDEANGYFKPSGSSPGVCENKPCYNSVNNCTGYTLAQCPENGHCSECTIKKSDCSTGDTKYKLDSCDDGYEISGNSCISQCLNYRLDKCPDNASCTSCNIVNNDGTVAAKKYSFATCNGGYIPTGTSSSPVCTKTNCKTFLETSGGSINANKIFVSSQEELEKALVDRNSISSGVYEYQIVIADGFDLKGNVANLKSGINIKGIREILPSGLFEDACPKPTIVAEGVNIPQNVTFEGVDFNLGTLRSGSYGYAGIYGGGNFKNCSFIYGDKSNSYASDYLHIALTQEAHFENCTMDTINLTASGNNNTTYYFDHTAFDGGSITPVGEGTVNLQASSLSLTNGAYFGKQSTTDNDSENDKLYGFTPITSNAIIFNIYGDLTISSPDSSAAFHNFNRTYKNSRGETILSYAHIYLYANITFMDTSRLIQSFDTGLYYNNNQVHYTYYIKNSMTLPSTLIYGDPQNLTKVVQ